MSCETTPLDEQQLEKFEEAMAAFYANKDNSQLDALFDIFDRDGNGHISKIELRTTMSSVYPEGISEQEIVAMLDEADTNNDGMIDPQEFKIIMIRQRDS